MNSREVPSNKLVVMTFNIHGTNDWEERKESNVLVIESKAPTIIGFQEVQAGNLYEYERKLKGYKYFPGPQIGVGVNAVSNPIFWQESQLELVDSSEFENVLWLHPNQEVNTIAGDWGAAYPRAANIVILKHKSTNTNILVINTHLDHISGLARVREAELIIKEWREIKDGRTTIMTGDFNSGRYAIDGPNAKVKYTDPVLELFNKAGFVDTFAPHNIHELKSFTFHDNEGDHHDPLNSHGLGMVDKILIQGDINSISFKVVTDSHNGKYPSDHYPAVAKLALSS